MRIEDLIVPAVDEKWAALLQATFEASVAEGLLLLAPDTLTLSVPPSPALATSHYSPPRRHSLGLAR